MKLVWKRRAALAGVAVLMWCLAGCMSPDGMRRNKPVELRGQRPAVQVAACAAGGWERESFAGSPSVTMRPTERGYTVLARNEPLGNVVLVLDVDEAPPGSVSRMYSMGLIVGAYEQVVELCQK